MSDEPKVYFIDQINSEEELEEAMNQLFGDRGMERIPGTPENLAEMLDRNREAIRDSIDYAERLFKFTFEGHNLTSEVRAFVEFWSGPLPDHVWARTSAEFREEFSRGLSPCSVLEIGHKLFHLKYFQGVQANMGDTPGEPSIPNSDGV